jgi:uncharacterized protein YceK
MSAIEGLGRVFNLATSATTGSTRVNMKDTAGVTFVLIGATSGAATISEHNAASSGTTQALATTTRYWTQASGLWTLRTQAAASTVTAVTGGLLAVYVSALSLSAGFTHLSISHATGSFVYILHDLNVGRGPANLAAVTA